MESMNEWDFFQYLHFYERINSINFLEILESGCNASYLSVTGLLYYSWKGIDISGFSSVFDVDEGRGVIFVVVLAVITVLFILAAVQFIIALCYTIGCAADNGRMASVKTFTATINFYIAYIIMIVAVTEGFNHSLGVSFGDLIRYCFGPMFWISSIGGLVMIIVDSIQISTYRRY